MEGGANYWEVERKPFSSRRNCGSLDFYLARDKEHLYRLFIEWKNRQVDIAYINWGATKWVLNKLLATIALYRYKEIVKSADKMDAQHLFSYFSLLDDKALPCIFFVLPSDNQNPIEFHMWNNE